MPFPVIPSFVTVGLFRLGYKLAENKKWLPDYIYHNLSVNKLKDGDLEKALYFNRIAIDKNPHSEKAQIMRDIINMRKDMSLLEIERKIKSENQAISELKERYHQTVRAVRRQKLKKYLLLAVFIAITLLYLSAMFVWAYLGRSVVFYIILVCGMLTFSGILLYQRTIGLGSGIRETILLQERLISLKTLNKELEFRKKRLNKFEEELENMIREFV